MCTKGNGGYNLYGVEEGIVETCGVEESIVTGGDFTFQIIFDDYIKLVSVDTVRYQCRQCPKMYNFSQDLRKHQTKAHGRVQIKRIRYQYPFEGGRTADQDDQSTNDESSGNKGDPPF